MTSYEAREHRARILADHIELSGSLNAAEARKILGLSYDESKIILRIAREIVEERTVTRVARLPVVAVG